MPHGGVLRTGWMVSGLAAVLLAAAHVYALRQGADLVGPALALDHLFTVALAGGLLGLCAALGRATIRRLCLEHDSAIDMAAFSMAVGGGILSTAILLCGAIGGLHPWILGLLLTACVVVSRHEIVRLPQFLRSATTEFTDKAGAPALVVLLTVGVGMTVQAIAPPTDYDSLMYHIQVPAQFLQTGAVYLPEDNLHVAQVGLVHMLYLPFLALGAPAACALMNTMLALALGTVLLTVGHRLFSPTAGRLAMVLFWGSPIVILVALTPKMDVTLALYLFLGHYALLCALRSTEGTMRWIALAGGLLGFAAGIKYQAFAYVAALAPVVLAIAVAGARTGGRRVRLLAVFGIAFTAAVLPWLLKNWALLGAPLYPFLSEAVLPPWLAALHGSSRLPPNIDPASLQALSAIRDPFDLVSWFTAPERITPEGEGTSYGANAIFVLLPLALPLVRNRTFVALLGPGLLYVGLVLLFDARTNLRYLLPAIPVLTIAAACALSAIMTRVRLPPLRALLIGTAVLTSLAPSAIALARKLVTTNALEHSVGLVSRHDYGRLSRDGEIADYARMTAYANGHLPRDARVLLLFEARGYGYQAHVLQDNVLTNWPLLVSVVAPPRCLESSGVTHVLVGTSILAYFVNRGLDPSVIRWDRFEAFADRCLALLSRQPEMDLYRVISP